MGVALTKKSNVFGFGLAVGNKKTLKLEAGKIEFHAMMWENIW